MSNDELMERRGNGRSRPTLSEPDPAAVAHSVRLGTLLRERIAAAGGAITFEAFVRAALYEPGLGYYVAGTGKMGAAGDFVTAPEIGSLFGRCIAGQIQDVLNEVEGGEIFEFGAGSGALAAVILNELAARDALPRRYVILEVSPDLRLRQEQRLREEAPALLDRVFWVDSPPEAGFEGVMLANEVLDALPMTVFRVTETDVAIGHVADEGGTLGWRFYPRRPGTHEGAVEIARRFRLPEGYQTEYSPQASTWCESMGARLGRGLLLLIDYGYTAPAYYHPQRGMGTLRCHYAHHAHDDPFWYPGLQDITAHVDFSAMAEAGRSAGLDVAGFASQSAFLLSLGLTEMVAGAPGESGYVRLAQEMKRLTLPSEMGEIFKVLALTHGIDSPLRGFQLQDQVDRL